MITTEITPRIDTVSEGIWSSMVNIPITLKNNSGTRAARPGKIVTSSVQIVGSWNGAVCLDMDESLARSATASLVGLTPSELTNDDVRDAAGELANMTAGGVKELLPHTCQISLPTVVTGTDFQVTVPQGVVVYCSEFETEFGGFSVALIEAEGTL